MRQKFILSILNILMLCVVITAVSVFFINNARWIGFVLIILALLCIVSLIPFKIKLKSIQPDIFFGLIDNGILAVMAIFGGMTHQKGFEFKKGGLIFGDTFPFWTLAGGFFSIPKFVFGKLGYFYDRIRRHEDADYCRRAATQDIPVVLYTKH